jgi:hypothetical protein
MAWHKIDSAPKDGSNFDVWCENTQTRHVDCAYAKMNWGPQINPRGGLGRFIYGERPSHWMPPPAPPRS